MSMHPCGMTTCPPLSRPIANPSPVNHYPSYLDVPSRPLPKHNHSHWFSALITYSRTFKIIPHRNMASTFPSLPLSQAQKLSPPRPDPGTIVLFAPVVLSLNP